ncbi:MAG: sialate O-acetylesterase [Phycisphaeraceae bacterium]
MFSTRNRSLSVAIALVAWVFASGVAVVAADKDAQPGVKVFILAGQSNMVGAGEIVMNPTKNEGKGSLEYLVKTDPVKYSRLKNKDGNWTAREDVQIWYFQRHGPLKAGYGGSEKQIGPELGFGWVVGDAFEQPVLLIKIAWGGKSIGKDFRPPSSGGEVGPSYTEMIKHVKETMRDAGTLFPKLKDRKLELAGLGWHQGWNDRVNQAFNDAYEENLSNFIRDVRKELGAAKLPFVIAETGMSGHEEKHPRALSLMKAQAAVAAREEFKGNVAFVGTKDFFRTAENSPANQAFHWNRNAETYYLIGEGMGEAMLKLMKGK